MSRPTDKKTTLQSLWVDIDVLASETIRGALWIMRPFALSLPTKERTALRCLLETNVLHKTEQFRALAIEERKQPGSSHLTDDELLERSSRLREAYRQRREAEALFHVLCRDIEQVPPKRMKGAKPC